MGVWGWLRSNTPKNEQLGHLDRVSTFWRLFKSFSRWEFEVGCEATLRKTIGLIRYLIVDFIWFVPKGRRKNGEGDQKRSLTYWEIRNTRKAIFSIKNFFTWWCFITPSMNRFLVIVNSLKEQKSTISKVRAYGECLGSQRRRRTW